MTDHFFQWTDNLVSAKPTSPLPQASDEAKPFSPLLTKLALTLAAVMLLAATLYGYHLIAAHDAAFARLSTASALGNRTLALTTAMANLEHAEHRFSETGKEDEFLDVRRMLHDAVLLLAKSLEAEQSEEVRHLLGQITTHLNEHYSRILNSLPQADGTRDRLLFADLETHLLIRPLQEISALAAHLSDEASTEFNQTSANMWFAVAAGESATVMGGFAMFVLLRQRFHTLVKRRQELSGANQRLRDAFDERSAQLVRVETMFKSSLAASNFTMFIQNTDLAISWIHNPQFGSAKDLVGRRDESFMPREASRQTVAAKMQVIKTGIGMELEYSFHLKGNVIYKSLQISPIIENGKVLGIIGVSTDVTEERLRESKITALASELVHRNQNLLAIVSATARRMAETSESLADFEVGFTARLKSISHSFALIVNQDWEGAPLDDLIRTQIAATDPTLLERVTLSGEHTIAAPSCIEALGNAIHELTQNAVQHGAFNQANGTVKIDWWMETDLFGVSQLFLVWHESDGTQRIPTLTNRRFGLEMLEDTVPRALNGKAHLVANLGGIKWRLRCPWPDPGPQKQEMAELLSA